MARVTPCTPILPVAASCRRQFGGSEDRAGSGTVTSAPAGIVCGASCSASYASGTVVTLTAAAGSTFTGWSGACTGTGSCTVAMSAAAVTASFDRVTPLGLPRPNLALNKESYATGETFSVTVTEENAGDAHAILSGRPRRALS